MISNESLKPTQNNGGLSWQRSVAERLSSGVIGKRLEANEEMRYIDTDEWRML